MPIQMATKGSVFARLKYSPRKRFLTLRCLEWVSLKAVSLESMTMYYNVLLKIAM